MVQASHRSPLRLVAILEATTVNAVARNVLDFCEGLASLQRQAADWANVELSIITFDRAATVNSRATAPDGFVTVARAAGITIDVVRERFRFDLSVVSALKNLVARRAPDVITTHNVKSHFLARVCRFHRERPWVAFHHGYTSTDLKNRAYNQLDRWSLARADRIVAVCRAFALQLRGRGIPAERIVVHHNSISPQAPAHTKDVREVRERFAIGNGCYFVLTVGRLSREKGHLDLVMAFAKLRATCPRLPTKLVVVGEGPERAAIEATVRAHGLQDDVHLAGYIRDVRPFYAAADVFVLPSHSEGSPYVLLEAMSAGVPVVATAVGGIPEILTHEKTGFIVAPRDAVSLASAIRCVLQDADLARHVAANASALILRRYSLEPYVRALLHFYRSLTNGTAQNQWRTV